MGAISSSNEDISNRTHSPCSSSRIMFYGQNSPPITKRINTIQYIITDIYSGHEYDIYRDHNHQLWIDRNTNTSDTVNVNDAKMDFFHKNGVRVAKICANVMSDHIFWISQKGALYGSGLNGVGQLGLGDKLNRDVPALVECFDQRYEVIDVKSVSTFSILLCKPSNLMFRNIFHHWTNITNLPNDVVALIIKFYHNTKWTHVFSTGYSSFGAHCHDIKSTVTTWREIKFFESRNIVKISVGRSHSLFLEATGRIWVCGDNMYGQLGTYIGCDKFNVFKPVCLQYFKKNHLRIQDIACGENHNIAIDFHGNAYAWGQTKYGQCGRIPTSLPPGVKMPQLIPSIFPSFDIVQIECGAKHSYCKSRNGRHFLFGSNQYNECITYDNRKSVYQPHCINKIIERKSYSKIKRVFLGYYNTKVIVNKHFASVCN